MSNNTDMETKQKRIHQRIIYTSLIVTLIIGLLLLSFSFIFDIPYYLSITFVISGLISVGNYLLLIYKTQQSVEPLLKKTIKVSSFINICLFALALLVLFFLFHQDKWVVFAFLFGYLILKFVIFFQYGLQIKE